MKLDGKCISDILATIFKEEKTVEAEDSEKMREDEDEVVQEASS